MKLKIINKKYKDRISRKIHFTSYGFIGYGLHRDHLGSLGNLSNNKLIKKLYNFSISRRIRNILGKNTIDYVLSLNKGGLRVKVDACVT